MDNQKLDEDNYHQYATPTSTLSSGYGNYYGGFRHEDNLPEVRADTSPQALSSPEVEFKRKYFEEQEPKYPVVYDDAPKTIVVGDESLPSASPTTTAAERSPEAQEPPVADRKICGLKRRMFFIILVVVLVIITIAVGGGVGGAMSSKSKSKSKTSADSAPASSTSSETSSRTQAPALASQSSTITSSSGVSSSTTITSSAPPSSTLPVIFLNNQTTPSSTFAFQGFAAANYLGNATSITHNEGGTNFPFQLNSYVWLPNATSCCLSFCLNATNAGKTGWWCDERYQPSASGPFGRIFVWCGQPHLEANAVCV